MSSHSSSHGVVALAFADEVIERPRLLESYACAFTERDDVTLVVLARDADAGEAERTFAPLAAAAGLDADGSPDVVVLAVPGDADTAATIAGSVQLVVTDRPAPPGFSALPAVSPESPADWLRLVRAHPAPAAPDSVHTGGADVAQTTVPPTAAGAPVATDALVAVALADDVILRPELLHAYASAFTAGDPVTLLLYAPGVDEAELEASLLPLVAGTPLATDDGPDVVALAVAADGETAAAVAARAQVVYGTVRPRGPFARLPLVSLDELRARVLGEDAAAPAGEPAPVASRPLDAPPASIESLRRDPLTGVLLSPWVGEEAAYADGGERHVHEVVAAAADTSVHSGQLAAAIRDWPSLYHLSPYRSTLYDCLGLTRPVDVVELGAGCGATTRWLGERMRSVLAVEGSRARAAVIRERCADLDTVDVVVGNFADVDLRGRADLVTLIGVLEYSHLYSLRHPGDPAGAAVETLELARGALRDDGLLLLAIENSLGLKYWNGAREDHSGRVHESIEGYPDLRTASAFNARQLERMARQAGFDATELLLPFPDYKLPRVVLDGGVDHEELGLHNWVDTLTTDRGFDDRVQHFSERLALREVVRAGLLRDLANSFLLLAYAGDPAAVRERLGVERDWAARHYSLDRAPVFRKRTTLRAASGAPATVEIETLVSGDGAPARFGAGRTEPHVPGDLLVHRVAEAGRAPDAEHRLAVLLAGLHDWLLERHGTGEVDADGIPLVAGSAIDAVWWNLVVDPGTGAWHEIDDEWRLDRPHPLDYVLWRGVEHLPARLGDTPEGTARVCSALTAALRLLSPDLDRRRGAFETWETSFQQAVLGIEDGQADGGPAPAAAVGSATFRCNVCGADAPRPERLDRETPSCPTCGSTPRFRSVVHALSLGLFGESLVLPDFPTRPDLRGVGLSDWSGYAVPLAAKLGYSNTYLHTEPRLDILAPDPALDGMLDFLVSSEVFAHVPPPARRALDAAHRLLRPGGVLVLTVPYGLEGDTVEHFPELHDWTLSERDGRTVLVNSTVDGRVQEFDDLAFHGSDGLTVEMRVWSLPSLLRELGAAGFTDVTVLGDDVPEHGIAWPNRCSRPILARRASHAAGTSRAAAATRPALALVPPSGRVAIAPPPTGDPTRSIRP